MAIGTLDDTPNLAISTLAAELSSGGTSMSVNDPSLFPAPTNGYNAVIWGSSYDGPHQDSTHEFIRVTAKPSSYSISRSQEGTSAKTWPAGSKIMVGVSEKFFSDLKSILAGINRYQVGGYFETTIAANQSDVRMWRHDAQYVNASRFRAIRDGKVTGLIGFFDRSVTAGSCTITVYVNGSSTELSVTLDSSTGWYQIDTGEVSFVAGSRIDVYYSTTSDFAPSGVGLMLAEVEVTTP